MPALLEQQARQTIDAMLAAAGWAVQDYKAFDPSASLGIALREVPLKSGRCDYLLLVNRKPVGVVEAKKEGVTLSTVADQSAHYAKHLPDFLATNLTTNSLPFRYESTDVETFFRNERDPHPRPRRVFSFHRPETLAQWIDSPKTLRRLLAEMPFAHPINRAGMRNCQFEANTNLDLSLAEDRLRSLIQMATGSGKTFTACAFTYRLIKFAKAKRVLFLVDRANLGRQVLEYFDAHLMSLTATPSKQTIGFFGQNLVMEPSGARQTAEYIVHLVWEVFGNGTDFCKKITYQAKHPTPGKPAKSEDLIAEFRTSPQLRIAVTVDMIATGTDIKPLECLLFLRDVRSRVYFEQMKGPGTRVLTPTDLQSVSGAEAKAKTHFIIVDAVGVCESDKTESRTLEKRPIFSPGALALDLAIGKHQNTTHHHFWTPNLGSVSRPAIAYKAHYVYPTSHGQSHF